MRPVYKLRKSNSTRTSGWLSMKLEQWLSKKSRAVSLVEFPAPGGGILPFPEGEINFVKSAKHHFELFPSPGGGVCTSPGRGTLL